MEADFVVSIVCPKCGTELEPSEALCGQCGANTSGDHLDSQPSQSRLIDKPWLLVVLILHVGFLGIPLYWRTKYSAGVRLAMVIVSIVYTVLAVAIIVWFCKFIFNAFRPLLSHG